LEMIAIVVLAAIFMAGLGLYGLVSPQGLAGFASRWRSERGLWTAAVIRVVFGIVLWQVAPSSRAPLALQILAAVTVAAGIALPFLGLARFVAVLDWWAGRRLSREPGRGWRRVLGCFCYGRRLDKSRQSTSLSLKPGVGQT
jgi:hypothetical protein